MTNDTTSTTNPRPDQRADEHLAQRPDQRSDQRSDHRRRRSTERTITSADGPLRFPERTLQVTAWVDPVLDKLGHDPRSGYVERYWLPVLGPSCLLLLRRLAAELEQAADGFEMDCDIWARELGIGFRGGQNSPFWRAVERTCRFEAAYRSAHHLVVRRRLPPLTIRQTERLPDSLRQAHRDWAEQRLAQPTRPTLTTWTARRVDPPPSINDQDPTAA